MLAPFAPHLTEEIWHILGHKQTIYQEKWPKYDENLTQTDHIELVIQINGKVRDRLMVNTGILENEAQKFALKSEKIQKWLNNQQPKKIIFVQDKLVNIVI